MTLSVSRTLAGHGEQMPAGGGLRGSPGPGLDAHRAPGPSRGRRPAWSMAEGRPRAVGQEQGRTGLAAGVEAYRHPGVRW